MNAISKLIATAFGAGLSPIAPGTCGTAAAVPLAWALGVLPVWQFAIVAVAVTALGILTAELAGRAWNTEDDQRIVIDEVAGYLLTVTPVIERHWAPLAVGFVVFRFFDIVKPFPVRWLDDNLPGGWGVVLDDAAAGVMGAIVMIVAAQAGLFTYLAGL